MAEHKKKKVYSYSRNDRPIPVIPTKSHRKRLATGILNSIALEHEEYVPALKLLTCYPMFRWICESRRCVDSLLPGETVYDIMESLREEGYDIPPLTRERSRCFELAEKVNASVGEAIGSLLNAASGKKLYNAAAYIHDPDFDGEPVSIYNLNTHYGPAILHICENYSAEFSRLYEEMNYLVAADYFETVENPALKAARIICDDFVRLRAREKTDPRMKKLCAAVKNCRQCLPGCPKDSELVCSVAELILRGIGSCDEMVDEMELAWNTIVRYRLEFYSCMASLLFGYTPDETIFWLWQVQPDT